MTWLKHRKIDVQHCQGFSTNRAQAAMASNMTRKTDLSAYLVKWVNKHEKRLHTFHLGHLTLTPSTREQKYQ